MTAPDLCLDLPPRVRRLVPLGALAVAGLLLAGCSSSPGRLPATPAPVVSDRSVVTGVEDGDVLKLRAGAGTGYRILVGLPNGTVVINRGCERVGGTPWCDVSPEKAPRLRGYVSGHYLTPK